MTLSFTKWWKGRIESVQFVICSDIESLHEKIDASHSEQESSTIRIDIVNVLIHYSHIVHLMAVKLSLIIIEVSIL